MNFSFAGCGFLGIYHVGVASCLKQHAPQLIDNATFSGASAGAIVSACLMCGCCLGECTSFTLRLATKARSKSLGPLHPSFDIARILRDALNEVLPENAHEICSGRLHISLTRVTDRQAVLVSEYHSKADLIQALLCSAHVPLYSGLLPPLFHGTRYVDGGLSDNLPILNEETITVSPFSGESDICPTDDSSNYDHIILANTSMQCTTRNVYRLSRALFPPRPQILSDMCTEGFDDCLKFLQKNNLISCTRHLSVRSNICPVTSSSQLCPVESTEDEDKEEETCEPREEVKGEEDLHGANCQDCKKKMQGALTDTLPPLVADVFQAACDSMNKGLQSYVHKSPVLRVASVLVAPWYLPADIMYNYAIRVLEYLPSLPSDVRMMYQESANLLHHLIESISNNRRKYTARFTCQLAITEINYLHHQKIPKSITASPYQPDPANPTVRNLNIGFAVDFETRSKETLRSLRHREGHLINHMDVGQIELQSQKMGKNVRVNSSGGDHSSNQLYDTFEQCLHISNEMESVMAYYYKDERNDECYNFQEIYDIDNLDIDIPSPRELSPSQSERDVSNVTWHQYLESKPGIENTVEEMVHDVMTIPQTDNS